VIRELYRERRGRQTVDLRALYGATGEGARTWPIVPFAGAAAAGRITWEKTGTSTLGRTIIDRYALRHGSFLLPLVHIHASQGAPSGRAVLRVALPGKIAPGDWAEVEADLRRGDEVVSFDPRGLGETRLRYKAESIDDKELAPADEEAAYLSPLSGVLANYVYNALLTGRPYLLDILEDAHIAVRFSRERLGARAVQVAGKGDANLLAWSIASVVPGVDLQPGDAAGTAFTWADAVEGMRETWPIQYLLPGGAYVRMRP
jgi:hypothetical protein